MIHPEGRLQRAVAAYLTLALPDDAVFTAIPSGGGGRLRGAILNGMGLKAGCPDLLVAYRSRVLMIELKTPVGRISPAQKAFHRLLDRAGIPTVICRSLIEVAHSLMEFGIPLNARIAA